MEFIEHKGNEKPYELDEFKDRIDMRGGFLQEIKSYLPRLDVAIVEVGMDVELDPSTSVKHGLAQEIADFDSEIDQAREETQVAIDAQRKIIQKQELAYGLGEAHAVWYSTKLIPDLEEKFDPSLSEPYFTSTRSPSGIAQDKRLPLIKKWLRNPHMRPEDYDDKQYLSFTRYARSFFLDKEGRLYRRGLEGKHQLVVDQDHRMYMMKSAHDSLGHREFYATKSLIGERFWWPEFKRDVSFYVKSCHQCQLQQTTMIRLPPVETHTPSIFQTIHIDNMKMSPTSNGFTHIAHGRCALTGWSEARALRSEKAREIGLWLFEDIICRWGCLEKIVTDNAPSFKAAVAWIEQKYGIRGIQISAYNSRANGTIERGHWDIRQALIKATGGDTTNGIGFCTMCFGLIE